VAAIVPLIKEISMETKVNLSEKIREHLKSIKPSDRSPKAVVEALKAKGIKVSPTLVAVIKGRMGGNENKAKAKKKIARVRTETNMENLLHAKNFLKAVGGLKEAKGLLETVNSLIS
jgi:hypothetical protein